MKDLEKLMSNKKDAAPMDDKMAAAKEQVLQELIEMMQGLRAKNVGDDMESMQQVSVMAPDAESLEEGLEQAQDVVENIEQLTPADDEMQESPAMKEMAASPIMVTEEEEEPMSIMERKKRRMMGK